MAEQTKTQQAGDRVQETAIDVSHLTKVYKLYNKPSDRLKEAPGRYAALWLSLLCDGLTILYNKVYEYYKTTEDASEGPSAARHQDAAAQGSEVPEMQLEDNG